MDFYGFNSAPNVRENHTVTGSNSGPRNTAIPDQLLCLHGLSFLYCVYVCVLVCVH